MAKWADVNILQLLNGKLSPTAERVTWIVEACQRVIRLDQDMKLPPGLGQDKKALDAEIGEIMEELYARVSKFRCAPLVLYCGEPDQCFDVQYRFVVTKETASEGGAVAWLVEHIDTAHRIRRCHRLQCRKWFFAITDRQKYCTDHCRKTDAQQGPEFRKRRAEYMRERYRPTQKERDAKIDAQAMIGTAKPKRKSRRQGNAKS